MWRRAKARITMAMMRFRFLKGFWNFPAWALELWPKVRNLTKSVAATIVATVARMGKRTLKSFFEQCKILRVALKLYIGASCSYLTCIQGHLEHSCYRLWGNWTNQDSQCLVRRQLLGIYKMKCIFAVEDPWISFHTSGPEDKREIQSNLLIPCWKAWTIYEK